MKKKVFLLLAIACLLRPGIISAQSDEAIFSIYLVRHSEKVIDPDNLKNPPLTECGMIRSENLASFLSAVDISRIYSTDFLRTVQTAEPTANKKGLNIEKYGPSDLESFAKKLLGARENVLVVGHSNTTPLLAGLLCGKEFGAMHESIYNRIYQVIIYENKTQLNIFHTELNCNK